MSFAQTRILLLLLTVFGGPLALMVLQQRQILYRWDADGWSSMKPLKEDTNLVVSFWYYFFFPWFFWGSKSFMGRMYQNVRKFPVTDIISTESLQFCLGSRYSTRCYIMLYICITIYDIITWKYTPHFNLFGMPSGSFGTDSCFWSIYKQHSLVGTHPSFAMLYTSSQVPAYDATIVLHHFLHAIVHIAAQARSG